MEDQETGELRDYKFFCFNGEPKLMFVATERGVKNTKFPLITFPYVSRILLPIGTGKVSFATSIVSYFTLFAQLRCLSLAESKSFRLTGILKKMNRIRI